MAPAPVTDAFGAALERWLVRQATAEERLTAFAFVEGSPSVTVPVPSSHDALRRWILATVGDPEVDRFLRSVDGDGLTMTRLAADGALGMQPGDRVAVAARIGVLTATGLVARELEVDRVRLTDLGRAALDAARPRPAGPGPAARGPLPAGTP